MTKDDQALGCFPGSLLATAIGYRVAHVNEQQ